MSDRARSLLVDAVGFTFIPLYRFVGNAAAPMIFIFLCLGFLRVIGTVVVRTYLLVKQEGVGWWLFSVIYGMAFHMFMEPIKIAARSGRKTGTKIADHIAIEAGVMLYPL